jgi:hypothetical protein
MTRGAVANPTISGRRHAWTGDDTDDRPAENQTVNPGR